MLSIINSSNLVGIDSFLVKVEVDVSNGIPSFNIGRFVKETIMGKVAKILLSLIVIVLVLVGIVVYILTPKERYDVS
ncbi:hypothetical protein ACTPD5_21510, partial [Clostridioides difficile]